MTTEKEKSKESLKALTAEEARMCAEISETDLRNDEEKKESELTTGEKIARKYKKRGDDFKEKTFRLVHEIANDPNKMAKDDYRYLIKGIAEGGIYVGGDNGLYLVRALIETIEGDDEEKKAELHKKLKRIDGGIDSEFINNKEKAKRETKKLKAVGEEKEERLEAVEETAKATTKRAEEITKTPEETKWSPELPPRELVEALNDMDRKMFNLAKEEARLAEEPEKNQKRIKEIDEEIDAIRAEGAETREKWENYLTKMLARFRAIRFFTKRAGFDPAKVEKITAWLLQTAKEPAGGLEIDRETGAAKQKRQNIKVEKIFFEKESSPITEETSPGQLMIKYSVTEDGKKKVVVSSYKNFLGLIDALDGYEEIPSTEEFNAQYAYELAYGNIEALPGAAFTGREEGDTFKVEKVYEKKGKWYITLNNTVMKTSRHLLPYSVHPSLYFDRTQREFELGEFGSFLRRNGYQRDISADELQRAVDVTVEETSMGRPEELAKDKIKIPINKEEVEVAIKENGKRRKGKLRRTGENEFELEYERGYNDPQWGIPQPATGESEEKGNGRYTVEKRKVNSRNLLEMANKGEIENASQEEEAQTEEEEISPTEEETDQEPQSEQLAKAKEAEKKELKKPKYYEEALPYEEIHKVGGMERVEQSWLKRMWDNTRFLSTSDIWEMGKAMWEYYERRWQRRQKEKYSSVGSNLPFWAPDMQRINQTAENEEMGQFKEALDQKGVYEIIERLEKTRNKDEMKAALTALSEKGQMRWDNIDFWRNLNRFVDPALAIPIPTNGDPNTEMSATDSRTGFDFLKDAIDSLWGEGQYNEWYRQQKSTYLSNAKSYYEKGKELEGVEGGPGRRLAVLLDMHKKGEFVDPHEYEGLILFSLDYGKARMQEKIYYMIEGVAAENMNGNTILSFDRMAHINSEMLQKFPILEYLCATVKREDGEGHTFTIDDYKRWVSWFDADNPMATTPSAAVDEFLWRYAIPNDSTQNRINKDLRNGENLDHDDMFAFLPPASTQVLTDSCKSTTGSKKFLTIEGYANVFPGFSQYFKSLAEYGYIDKLADAIKSYVRFEGIMQNKFEKAKTAAQDTYQRMDEVTLSNATIVSNEPPSQFIGELNKVVQGVVAAYNNEELNRVTNIIFTEGPVEDVTTKEGQAQQNEINQAYYKFEEIFKDIIKKDGGEKMAAIISSAQITGMGFTPPAVLAKRRAELTAK